MVVATASTRVGRVWIVETPGEPADHLEQLVTGQGYITWRSSGAERFAEQLYPVPDVVLIDSRSDAGMAGELLDGLRADTILAAVLPIILLPALPTGALLSLITAAGADFLVAPLSDDELLVRLSLALGRSELRRHDRDERALLARELATQRRLFDEQQGRVARLQAIFERLPIGAIVVSPTNQIEAINAAFCRFLGYRSEELVGCQSSFMTPLEDNAATIALGHQLAAGQIDQFVHERRHYLRKDGSIVLGRLTSYALRDDQNRPLAYLAFVEDIGNRVLIEDQLARNTRYQQALADASLSLLALASDEATRESALSQALQQLVDGANASRAYLFRNVEDAGLGLAIQLTAEAWSAGQRPLHELDGARVYPLLPYALIPAAHRHRILTPLPSGGLVDELYGENPQLLAFVRAEGIRSTQTVPVLVDGDHWGFVGFDDSVQPRVWDHTDVMLLTGAATLLGQTLHRWRIEDDLRAAGRLLQTTGRVARVGGWALDLASSTLTISDELAALLEVAPAALGDVAALIAFCAPEARATLQGALQAAVRTGDSWELELPFVTADGHRLWISSQGQVEQFDGRVVRLFGTAQDVTRRKVAELQLEQQLRIETALAKCSQELLAPVNEPDDLRAVGTRALEHLRAALEVDQAFLIRLVDDPAEPYFTMVAFASEPIEIDPYAFPLAQCFPLSLLPPRHLAYLDAAQVYVDLPHEEEIRTDAQRAWMAVEQARSRLCIPVRSDDRLWGVLGFSGLTPREWGAEEVAVLVTAAEMLSHVIRRWTIERELRQSEEQFRTAVETMLDGFAILDSVRAADGAIHDFRFRYINEVGSRMNQQPREDHLGHTLLELLPAHAGSALLDDYVRLVETGTPVSRESLVYEDVFGAGERLAWVVDVRATRLGDGMAVVWRDVTDRHLAHESLALANDDLMRRVNELRTLNLIAQTLASTRNLSDGLAAVCRAVATRTGAARAVVVCFERTNWEADREPLAVSEPAGVLLTLTAAGLGPHAASLLDLSRPVALARAELAEMLSEGALQRLGLESAAYLLLAPLTSATGNLGMLVLGSEGRPFGTDDQSLVETIAGQVATAISNAWLAEQAQQAARLAERNRVARDLHDSATQALYSLSLLAGGWALHAEQGPLSDVPAKFNQLGGIALQVLKELRLLIYELRHPDLAKAGLVKTLEERLAAVEQRATIRTSLSVSGEVGPLPQRIEEQVFTLLQEALNNALRHAQARSVAVCIQADGDRLVCTVRDDGVGFELDRPSSGLGLRSMRERAAAIGAQIHFASTPGQGTLVELHIPVPEPGGKTHG